MSTGTGRAAEDTAVNYLLNYGFEIMHRNWRTKFCEIDIVASKDKAVHFVEVKYRSNPHHGSSLDYIAARKQRQLKRAAMAWVGEHDWEGDWQIDAIGIDGKHVSFVPNVIND